MRVHNSANDIDVKKANIWSWLLFGSWVYRHGPWIRIEEPYSTPTDSKFSVGILQHSYIGKGKLLEHAVQIHSLGIKFPVPPLWKYISLISDSDNFRPNLHADEVFLLFAFWRFGNNRTCCKIGPHHTGTLQHRPS